jgi:hypothetical protein
MVSRFLDLFNSLRVFHGKALVDFPNGLYLHGC